MSENTKQTLPYDQLLQQFAALQSQNQQLLETVSQLTHQLETLQRMLFGQRSERQGRKKPANSTTPTPDKSDQSSTDSSRGNGRRRLPPELPRTVIKHDLPEDARHCLECQGHLHCIGKDVSEQLEFIQPRLRIIEHRRYKYACRCCQALTIAPMPAQPIDKGLAGCGLLADTLITKYEEHCPLYRLSKRYARLGYAIPRSTLCDWVMACAERLSPIVVAMQTAMLHDSPKIHSDDTIIPILARNKTHKGRLWVYIGGGGRAPPTVIYRYSKTRAGREPQTVLSNYHGYLQADAYPGYDRCFESGAIIEVACMAHTRRKFVDALDESNERGQLAKTALAWFAELYAIEKRGKSLRDKQRYYLRRHDAKPRLKQFYRWLRRMQQQAVPKSPVGQAINYAMNHWQALTNYLRDGVLAIDNNIAERAMKSVVLGRKNYLFAGSHRGAENAAVIYSLIETCKALNINTFDYLSDVLARLPTTLSRDILSLTPQHWKPNESTSFSTA